MILNEIAIKRNVLTIMGVVAIIVFGLNSYRDLGVDLMPDVEFPFVTIQTILAGADPETVESTITTKLEDTVSTISNIKELNSTSSESLSLVMIQFELEVDVDVAAQEVRDKIAAVRSELPKDIEAPIVQKFDINATPVIYLVVSSEDDIASTTQYVDDFIKAPIQNINGVGNADIIGGREREIRIWIDPVKLEAYGLSPSDIAGKLQMENVEIPGGRIEEGANNITIKTKGNLQNVSEFSDIILSSYDGSNIKLGNVARIEDGVANRKNIAKYDGKNAVSVQIKKQSGANTVAVAEAVREKVAELKKDLPRGYDIVIASDTSTYIKSAIDGVIEDLILGGIIAILITFFFLRNIRTTLIVAIVIPSTLIGSFTLIKALGFTINQMVMLAMSISTGILIDDVIVMIENIFRHFEMGKKRLTAAKEGAGEISFAVVSIGLVIMCVFVPVAFMKGIIGRFFFQFGMTISFIIGLSMLFSLTLTPMLSSRFLKHVEKPNIIARGIEKFLSGIDKFYRGILRWAINHRLWTVLIGISALVLGIYLVSFVPAEFMPQEDRSKFNISFEAPLGTSLEQTNNLTSKLESFLKANYNIISSVYTAVAADTQNSNNKATLTINLVPPKERKLSQEAFINKVREDMKKLTENKDFIGCNFTLGVEGLGGHVNAAVTYLLQGPDIDELNKYSIEIIEKWKKLPQMVDVKSSFEKGKPELKVYIDRKKAAALGVSTSQIANVINMLFEGYEITKYRDKGEQYVVEMQLEKSFRNEIEDLRKIYIKTNTGNLINLINVVKLEQGLGPSQINRYGRQRMITLTANLEGIKYSEIEPKIEQTIKEVKLPAAYRAIPSGTGKMQKESFGYMFEALMLAIILIYLVIASQFNSFVHPFTIMMALPLSMVGVFFMLFITQISLNIFSMIGIIMLMGLVTKNAILLVDFTIQMRAKGLDKHSALLEAGPIRLRPIMMTTVAMIGGMFPIALALSEGSEIRQPMAVAVIGGLMTSSLLTLVVVPVIYSLMDGFTNNRLINWVKRFFEKEA